MEAVTYSFVVLNPVTDFSYMTCSVTLLDQTYTGSLSCLNCDVHVDIFAGAVCELPMCKVMSRGEL